jgi:hypothetical protein
VTSQPTRIERGRALLAAALKGMAGAPLTVSSNVDEMTAAVAAPVDSAHSPLPIAPDEERQIVQALLHKHYIETLDLPVPMLGNKTPRQAAKSAKGREKLVQWLKFLETGL